MPYLIVYIKLQGLTSSETGLIIGVMPFVAFVTNPVLGMIADRWNSHKAVLVIVILVTAISNLLIVFVPARTSSARFDDVMSADVTLTCHPNQLLGLSITRCVDVSDASTTLVHFNDTRYLNSETSVLCSLSVTDYSSTLTSSSRDCVEQGEGRDAHCENCPTNMSDFLKLITIGGNDSRYKVASCILTCPILDSMSMEKGEICLTPNDADPTDHTQVLEMKSCNATVETLDQRLDLTVAGLVQRSTLDEQPDKGVRSHVQMFDVTSLRVKDQSYGTMLCNPRLKMQCVMRCELSNEQKRVCAKAKLLLLPSSEVATAKPSPSSSPLSTSSSTLSLPSHRPTPSSNVAGADTSTSSPITTAAITDNSHPSRGNDLTFWLIFLFYLCGYLTLSPAMPMIDALCHRLLKDDWKRFGHNRVIASKSRIAFSIIDGSGTS